MGHEVDDALPHFGGHNLICLMPCCPYSFWGTWFFLSIPLVPIVLSFLKTGTACGAGLEAIVFRLFLSYFFSLFLLLFYHLH